VIVMESIKLPARLADAAFTPVLGAAFAAFFTAFFACMPHLAQAQKIYMCKDASGRTITSDRPIPECANRSVKELSGSGVVKREIPAPLTAEQRQLKKEEDARRQADAALAAEVRRRDVGLLATYQNEQQIDAERKRTLGQIRNNISIAVTQQNAALARRKAVQNQIAALTDKTAPVPAPLKAKVAEADKSILFETKTKESLEEELVKASVKYDEIIARYRLIVANGPGFDAGTAAAAAVGAAATATSSASKP
jgi:Domain of unknown function (DUF4124)